LIGLKKTIINIRHGFITNKMRAIILAGGKGTRLKPFTTILPKPLVPIGGKYAILEIIIYQLVKNNFTHVTLAVNHMAHLIQAYFGDGRKYGIKIDYSLEEEELSTIGPLTLINDLPENFLVMNGDILCDINYEKFFKDHKKKGARISVATFEREVNIDFGVIKKDMKNCLSEFIEKPKYKYEVSMGIYCLSLKAIGHLRKNKKYGFDDLMIDSIRMKQDVHIEKFSGYWLDIGRGEDYDYANQNFNIIEKKLKIK